MFTDMQLQGGKGEGKTKHLVITAKKFSAAAVVVVPCLWLRLQKYNLWPHSRGFSQGIDKVA